MGGYGGLRGYATASEDRELEAKLAVVEKYHKRIPELVQQIYGRVQRNPQCAGACCFYDECTVGLQ